MTFVFVSNYFNHHQAPFAKAMDEKTANNFAFIETEPIAEERIKMGWGGEEKPLYVRQSYIDARSAAECRKLINDADVVIWGSCPFSMIKPRLRQKKITFAYSERLFKRGVKGIDYWGRALKYWAKLKPYQNSNHYLLCASAYAAVDYARLGLFKERAYKWGYFPEVKEQDLDKVFARKHSNDKTKLLWAGRLIDWKHPEGALYVAEKLKSDGYNFEMNIIGSGKLEPKIREKIAEKNLESCVNMLGSMSPKNVREHMEAADIFLFTSDQNEGWGAVLNESMNSCCAVVASNAIGSAPFLIENEKNGFIYQSGNCDQLYSYVLRLIESSELREQMGRNAYLTLNHSWNAEIAAERFIAMAEGDAMFTEGICSK